MANSAYDLTEKSHSVYSSIRKAVIVTLVTVIPFVLGCGSSFYTQPKPWRADKDSPADVADRDDNLEDKVEKKDTIYLEYPFIHNPIFRGDWRDFDMDGIPNSFDIRPYEYDRTNLWRFYGNDYYYGPYQYGYDPYYRNRSLHIPYGYSMIPSSQLERLRSSAYKHVQHPQQPQLTPDELRQKQQQQREQQERVWQRRIDPSERSAPVPTIRTPNVTPQQTGKSSSTAPPSTNTGNSDESKSDAQSAKPKKTRR